MLRGFESRLRLLVGHATGKRQSRVVFSAQSQKYGGWRFAKLAARKLPRPIPCKFGIDTATKAAFRYQTCTKNALQAFRLQDWQTFGGRRSPEWGFAPWSCRPAGFNARSRHFLVPQILAAALMVVPTPSFLHGWYHHKLYNGNSRYQEMAKGTNP